MPHGKSQIPLEIYLGLLNKHYRLCRHHLLCFPPLFTTFPNIPFLVPPSTKDTSGAREDDRVKTRAKKRMKSLKESQSLFGISSYNLLQVSSLLSLPTLLCVHGNQNFWIFDVLPASRFTRKETNFPLRSSSSLMWTLLNYEIRLLCNYFEMTKLFMWFIQH